MKQVKCDNCGVIIKPGDWFTTITATTHTFNENFEEKEVMDRKEVADYCYECLSDIGRVRIENVWGKKSSRTLRNNNLE